MEMRLELVVVPVADIDAARAFYEDTFGFDLDHDVSPAPGARVVQLTPPGSACSIGFVQGLSPDPAEPGSLRGLHLVVDDIDRVRAGLIEQAVDVEPIVDHGGGVRMAGFADPDGNTWVLQELPAPS